MNDKNDSSTRSVDRTLDLLECFMSEEKELSLTEISEKSGLSMSTVHRLINALANRNYLKRNENNKKYYLGPTIMQLGSTALSIIQRDLRSIAYPYLLQIFERFHETVGLYVSEGEYRLCIDRIQTTQTLRNVVPIGQLVHFSIGGMGKILLAYMPLDKVRSILPDISEEFKKSFVDIRQNKYYISRGERVEGTTAIGVPILNSLDTITCVLSISGPEIRFPESSIKEKVAFLTQVGHDFSRALGYKEEYKIFKE